MFVQKSRWQVLLAGEAAVASGRVSTGAVVRAGMRTCGTRWYRDGSPTHWIDNIKDDLDKMAVKLQNLGVRSDEGHPTPGRHRILERSFIPAADRKPNPTSLLAQHLHCFNTSLACASIGRVFVFLHFDCLSGAYFVHFATFCAYKRRNLAATSRQQPLLHQTFVPPYHFHPLPQWLPPATPPNTLPVCSLIPSSRSSLRTSTPSRTRPTSTTSMSRTLPMARRSSWPAKRPLERRVSTKRLSFDSRRHHAPLFVDGQFAVPIESLHSLQGPFMRCPNLCIQSLHGHLFFCCPLAFSAGFMIFLSPFISFLLVQLAKLPVGKHVLRFPSVKGRLFGPRTRINLSSAAAIRFWYKYETRSNAVYSQRFCRCARAFGREFLSGSTTP